MKTIHALIVAVALAAAPWSAHAQSAATTTTTDAANATDEPEATDAAAGTDSDVGKTGTGTGDVGKTGTGTGDVGKTGTGTGTLDVGHTGTGTGTLQSSAPDVQPAVSLAAKSDSLRTPGVMPVIVTLAADASLDPSLSREVTVPLASSSSSCSVPDTVMVAWSPTDGGSASVDVSCKKAGVQTVTISSDAASVDFSTK